MLSVSQEDCGQDSVERRALVVLGMHRSGTSAMTRTLSLLGATLPTRLMVPVKSNNETGFWESQSVVDLNDEILHALDSEWDDVFAGRPREYLSNFDKFFLSRAVELLQSEFGEADFIVLKDPRISVLSAFWDRTLRTAGYCPHYIIMVRNPLEVAESLRARDEFPREKSLLLWSSYMVAMDRDTRGHDRTFVSYDQLMSDWRRVRKRIEADLGMPFPRDTPAASIEVDRHLQQRLRHHRARSSDLFESGEVPEHTKALYGIFSAACDDVDVDQSAVDAIRVELSKLDSLVGPLLADLKGRLQSAAREIADARDAAARNASDRERSEGYLVERATAAEADRDRLAGLVNERENEIAQLRIEMQAQAEVRDQLLSQIGEKELQLVGLQKKLATEIEEKDQMIVEVRQQLGSQLDEKGLQLVGLQDQLAIEVEKKERVIAEMRQQFASQLEDQERTAVTLREELAKMESELHVAQSELGMEKSAAADSQIEFRRREAQLNEEIEQQRVVAAEMHLELEARIDDRFAEIATLTNLLATQETRANQLRDQVRWLREASQVLAQDSMSWKARFRRMLPVAFHRRRQHRLLQQKGLFDREAYLDANPDVAVMGSDPLSHYLAHGIDENRHRV